MSKVTKVLFTRLGGVGDMVMAEPTLRAVREKYEPCHITYRTHRHVYDIMLFHPDVDEILCTRTGCWTEYPEGYDVHINLHGAIETAPHGMHGIDAFAQRAGVELKSRMPKMHLDGFVTCPVRSEDDRYPAIQPFIPEEPPVEVDIAFHVPQEPRNKAWMEPRIISRFMDFMDSRGERPEVRVVGQETIMAGNSNILRMAKQIRASRMFIGPDSGGFHLAAALGIPTVASFTDQFPAKMRSYPKVVAARDDLDEVFSVALAMHRKTKNVDPT